MPEEIIDIVDENNELTGETALRSKIHAEGVWHQTVHIYLFRKNNNEMEFLVHLRSPFKDLSPNCWDTRFGGHIKSGLTLEEGAKTELEEEIGLNADGYKLIEGEWRKRNMMPNREFTKTYFLEYLDNMSDLKFNDGEVQEIKWMSIQEIKDSMIKNPKEWSGSIKGFTEVSNYLLEKIII
ncbi:MAG: NUDIX domain-containing protein [bacterium]|nr:NUDIX domain-containing protein [bacterium]